MNTFIIPEKTLIGRREKAHYHDVVLPLHQGNPLIEALPPLRTQKQVHDLFAHGSPIYNSTDRDRPAQERIQLVATLQQVFVPMPRHLRIEEAVMNALVGSYAYRNPLVHKYMLGQVEAADQIDFNVVDYDEPMVGASCLIGWAGTGKSRSLKKGLVTGCPQVIEHADYKGTTLGLKQITWLYVSCAHDGSVKDLCCSIAGAMDAILGTKYKKHVEAKRTEHAMARELAGVTALHAVGLIIIDEVQNACIGRPIDRQRLTRFITKLMNSMSTRFMLVGTPEAAAALINDVPLLRRTVGDSGQIHWGRIETISEWKRFLDGIWKYQYTKVETPLDMDIAMAIHSLTIGIPDLAVKLYAMAQKEVIGHTRNGHELITKALLESVMLTRMPFAEQILAPIRKNMSKASEWNHPKTQQLWLGLGQQKKLPEDPEASAA